MRNEAASAECWGQIVQKFMQKVQMQRGVWVWKELVGAMCSSEEEHREFSKSCIDFPSNISVEHLTTTLNHETCFRRLWSEDELTLLQSS